MKILSAYFFLGLTLLQPVYASDSLVQKQSDVSFTGLLKNFSADYASGLKQLPLKIAPKPVKAAELDNRYWVTVYAANADERTRLLEAGLDIVEIQSDRVSGIIDKESLTQLSRSGFRLISAEPLNEHISRLKDFPAADAAYHNYQETRDTMRSLAAQYPDLASYFSIGDTVLGKEIPALRLNTTAKGQTASSKPGALFVGAHHACEHLSTEVPLLFAAWLLEHRADPDIKKYLETLDIYLVPMLNPDGVENDIAPGTYYKWYRKNMRVNADKTTGVDLNRNYDSWFCGAGSSNVPGKDTYCGTAPFSEPETLAVKKFIDSRPNLKTMLTYHSYASLVLYPWSGQKGDVPDSKDAAAFKKIAREMAVLTGYTAKKSSEMYLSTGDAADWAYSTHKIFAFTTELEGTSHYPGPAVIETAVKNNVKAALNLLSYTQNPYQ